MTRALPVYSVADLERVNDLELPSLTQDEAVSLGIVAVEVIRSWNLSLAVDIVLDGDLVFRAKLQGTGPGNDEWLAGKAAVANAYGEASLLVRRRREADGTQDEPGEHEAMKFHGGSVPLKVGGVVVGTITMSGEADAIDHEAAVEAIERYLGVADVDGRHEA